MKLFRNVMVAGFLSYLSTYAGVNQKAVLSLDMDPSTNEVESSFVNHNDSPTVAIALRIDKIVNIKGFAVRFNIDTTKLKFDQFVLNDNVNKNLLGSNPMSFIDNSEGSIEVIASTSQPVTAASGYLGTIQFKTVIGFDQQIDFSISYAEITDAANSLDVITTVNGGKLIVEKQRCTIKIIDGKNGKITEPAESTIVVEQNAIIPIKAKANSGFVFKEWKAEPSDAVIIKNPDSANTSITVMKDVTITAQFDVITSTDHKSPAINCSSVSWKYLEGIFTVRLINTRTDKINAVKLIDAMGRNAFYLPVIGKKEMYSFRSIKPGSYILFVKRTTGNQSFAVTLHH